MVRASESDIAPSVKCACVIACRPNLHVISAYHSKCLTLILFFKMCFE